jgi:hypothetical protein
MGVVHKLRDDVVDFILAQKKARPDISVRKLSAVVLKEFQVVVSKSSVSSVLKNANLNSPIGRHGSSVDEDAGALKKLAAKFVIPEQKKKQIFLSQKPALPEPTEHPPKIIKVEAKPVVNILPPKETKIEIPSGPLPVKIIENKSNSEMSNLPVFAKSVTEPIKNAGMIFLKAAEWDFAGGSILAKILKEELGGRFDINYELLADMLVFPELFDQNTPLSADYRGIEKLFSENAKNDILNPNIYSSVMAAVNNIQDCGLKLSVEMEIQLRGVSAVKIMDFAENHVFVSCKNKVISMGSVQSELFEDVSVAEAVRYLNTDISKNVHSAVFHYFSKVNNINSLIKFLLSVFGVGSGYGFKEVGLQDGSGLELLKHKYFSNKTRTFVLADWNWKDRWSALSPLGLKVDFKAVTVLGKTFYYKKIGGESLFGNKAGSLNVVILAAVPDPCEEPLVILLTNAVGEEDLTQNAVLDFLYSWPGVGEESGPSPVAPNAWKKDVFSHNLKILEAQSSLPQTIPRIREIFKIWAQHHFFGTKDGNDGLPEQFYCLPGHLRNENDRAVVVTLEAPIAYDLLEDLKNSARRFNSRMFRDPGGRRIFLKIAAPH